MSRPSSLADQPVHETKQRLIAAGLRLMLERGYNAVGIQELLDDTGVPRGSFYHHFENKEDFALQLVDTYQSGVHELLEVTLSARQQPPLERVRTFFQGVRGAYGDEGYLGCFLGALGQELSGASSLFRLKIQGCLDAISARIAVCLEEARMRGDLPESTDTVRLADVIVNAWEGAALRSRLARSARPLDTVLDFYLSTVQRH